MSSRNDRWVSPNGRDSIPREEASDGKGEPARLPSREEISLGQIKKLDARERRARINAIASHFGRIGGVVLIIVGVNEWLGPWAAIAAWGAVIWARNLYTQ